MTPDEIRAEFEAWWPTQYNFPQYAIPHEKRIQWRAYLAAAEPRERRIAELEEHRQWQLGHMVASAKAFSEKSLECKRLDARLARVTEALRRIERWELPATGTFLGERDYMRGIARAAIADEPKDKI